MLTMLLGGLWHGANWTFVAWGGLHGLYLWVEKFFNDRKERARLSAGMGGGMVVALAGSPTVMPKPVNPSTSNIHRSGWFYALFTFFLVNLTWVFFRASTFGGAGKILGSMFGMVRGATPLLTSLAMVKIGVIIACMLILHWLLRTSRVLDLAQKLPWWLTGIVWSGMVILLILSQESSSSFIYFQF
jgi:D-alanyl-lipoteichoic acid acyltransferase DltB (MBOAT superfamily)